MTCGGSTCPDLEMMLALRSARCQSMETPVALTARTVASATSGPMPSPGINVTGCDTFTIVGNDCNQTCINQRYGQEWCGGVCARPARPGSRDCFDRRHRQGDSGGRCRGA